MQCCIVNQDHHDPDVTVNLILFYESCGFEVTIGTRPQRAELLVIQRAYPKWIDPAVRVDARAVHVYDYSKMENLDYVASLPGVERYHLVTLEHALDAPRADLVYGNHPVMAQLWAPNGPLPAVRYASVHIGNRKGTAASDPLQASFERYAAQATECHFFGGDWQQVADMGRRAHGHITLHETQAVYRSSGCGFGIMYPYQRGRTLSGRMWQGPLNGCPIYTEASPPKLDLPGVLSTADYAEMLHTPQAMSHVQRQALVAEARSFWEQDAARLACSLGMQFRAPSPGRAAALYRKYVLAEHARLKVRRHLSRIKRALVR